jgi:hypothetical protein
VYSLNLGTEPWKNGFPNTKVAERFQKVSEGAFLPGAKDEKKPARLRGLSLFQQIRLDNNHMFS